MGWLGGIGLLTLFMAALLVFWGGFAMQSCSARQAVSDRERARSLVAARPVTVAADAVDQANEGQLVHVTGLLQISEPLADSEMGVTANALSLERRVEIYDWDASPTPSPSPSAWRLRRRWRSKASPSPSRSPQLGWRAQAIPDYEDHEPSSDARPASVRLLPRTLRLGAFVIDDIDLPPELKEATIALALTPEVLGLLPGPLRQRAQLSQGRIHVGDPAAPVAGDVRIGYFVTPAPREVTIVAHQVHGRLAPHGFREGMPVAIIKPGRLAARDVLQQEAVAAEAGGGAGFIFSVPLFLMGAFLAYFPLNAAGRVLPGLRVVAVEPGLLAFLLFGTAAISLGTGAYARWSAGAPGAGWSTAAAVAALGVLVVLGVWRMERRQPR